MNRIETIPQVWDDEREGRFFRITASLFSPAYCYGASVLLASYDADEQFIPTDDVEETTVPAQTARHELSH